MQDFEGFESGRDRSLFLPDLNDSNIFKEWSKDFFVNLCHLFGGRGSLHSLRLLTTVTTFSRISKIL